MLLYLITTVTLDVAYATTWWIISKTRKGISYIFYGNHNSSYSPLLLQDSNDCKELLEKILKKNETQEILINNLNNRIEFINNYLGNTNNVN